MYLRSLTIHGFSDLPHFTIDGLGRTVTISGPSPASSAVGDGLGVLFGAMNESVLRQLLTGWGLIRRADEAEIEAEPLPTQATWFDRDRAKTIVSDLSNRRIRVAADLALDPPLAATLRKAAVSEPRLGVALTEPPTVHVEVSAYFGGSWDVLSVSIQSVVIGSERFPCNGKERAPWLTALLLQLGQRFARHEDEAPHATLALKKMTSALESDYQGFLRFTEVVGPVRPVAIGDEAAEFVHEHRPIRRLGAARVRAIHAAATATLHNVDIMWLDDADPWSATLTETDRAPLEQLWSVGMDGVDPNALSGGHRDVLRFGTGEE